MIFPKALAPTRVVWGLAGLFLLAACGKPATPVEPAAAPAADPATTAAPAPAAKLPRQQAPEGARVAILSPADGATVSSPVKVMLDVQGIALAPAGDPTPATGHHHLLVDVALPADQDLPLPKDDKHVHLGKAQTETEIALTPGTHTLQALLADGNHVPHLPPIVSAPITITVQ
jgi:Domain of unknown function (DUF4399)